MIHVGKNREVIFTNEHNEVFSIVRTPYGTLLVSGDETEEVLLFNSSFSIFSNEELRLLGEALVELAGDKL